MSIRSNPKTSAAESEFDDWTNDDLLVSDTARKGLLTLHPSVFPLLDWPALRALFQRYESPANCEKLKVRQAGRRALWSAFLAFTLTALSGIHVGAACSVLSDLWLWVTGLGAFTFAAVCVVTGLLQMFHGGRKRHWMLERLWTETLRRFNFQFLLRNLSTAIDVMAGTKPIPDWHALQAEALATLLNEDMARPEDCLRDVLSDTTEMRIWVLTVWQNAPLPSAPGPSQELDELLSVLETKRLQIQRDYARRKLEGTKLALRGRLRLIRTWFYFLVFAVLGMDATVSVLRIVDRELSQVPAWLMLFELTSAAATAALVVLQMWDRGEQISSETDRMEWYLAGVDSLYRRFQMVSSPEQKIRLLAELETFAYQEMRQFLMTVDRGEFVAG
jgi:hypothetical protein